MPGRRSALLVVTSTYTDSAFRRLRAPGNDATELAKVLRDPEIGNYGVTVLRDRPAHEVRVAIEELFADADRDDLILLYVSGHGVKDGPGHLHFATGDTRRNRLASTGVPAQFVREQIDHSRASKVVVWLDCCYAGAFPAGKIPKAGGAVDVVAQVDARAGHGCAVMTATTAMQFAYEYGKESTVSGSAQPSIFTSAIVDGLRTGDADLDDDGQVGTGELYDYVYQRVKATTPEQTPSRNDLVTGELYVASSKRGIRLHPTLRADIGSALRNPLLHVRLGAAYALRELAAAGNEHATEALRQLGQGSDPDVASAARSALSTAALTSPDPPAPTPSVPPPSGAEPAAAAPLWRSAKPWVFAAAPMVLLAILVWALTANSLLKSRAEGGNPGPTTSTSSPQPTAAPVPVVCGGKANLVSGGSSAQKSAMDTFAKAYTEKCAGTQVNYNPNGSGTGALEFISGVNDFGGVDTPLKPEDGKAITRCHGNDAWHLPLVFTPIAIAYRLPGVTDLTLTAEAAAKIFSGAITRWNDPAIAALNPSVTLPSTPIAAFHRSDESLVTDRFQRYLTASSHGAWALGTGRTFNGTRGEAAQGSTGVAQAVARRDGAITYLEWGFAQSNALTTAKIDSGAGPVALNAETVSNAIRMTKTTGSSNDLILDLDQATIGYPLLQVTYEIVCSKGYDPDTAKAVKAFLTTAVTDGQRELTASGYGTIPPALSDKLLAAINAIG